MSIFKIPTEKSIAENKKMTPTDTVRALYSMQWQFYRDGYNNRKRYFFHDVFLF